MTEILKKYTLKNYTSSDIKIKEVPNISGLTTENYKRKRESNYSTKDSVVYLTPSEVLIGQHSQMTTILILVDFHHQNYY